MDKTTASPNMFSNSLLYLFLQMLSIFVWNKGSSKNINSKQANLFLYSDLGSIADFYALKNYLPSGVWTANIESWEWLHRHYWHHSPNRAKACFNIVTRCRVDHRLLHLSKLRSNKSCCHLMKCCLLLSHAFEIGLQFVLKLQL